MKESRTTNSIRNSTTSIVTQVLTVVINFIVKTVFIHTLGSEYLGMNGLFSNIITMLSLADLGIGLAIPYSLYKPLAEKNHSRINQLMKFYAKIYNMIGTVVLVIGLSLIPFLSYFIKEVPEHISHLSLIYALFVIHSASSYFFVYKRFLIESDQKGYITSRIIFIFSTLLSIIQIGILLIFQNFIFYLLSAIIVVVIQNIYISYRAMKMYPFLKYKRVENLKKDEIQEIKKNVSALFIYRIGTVVTNGTDNLVISKFLGLVTVGIYSNYLMIINSINLILNQVFNAITSSIGNLVVTTNEKHSANVYEKLNLLNFWMYGVCGICLYVLFNPFIQIWIGNHYLLSSIVTFLLALNFYITGMQSVTTSFRNAYGLFWKAKYRPIIMIGINLVLSVVLVQYMGIMGVVIGTIVSRLLTTTWLDPYIVYHYGFHKSPKRYYIKYMIWMCLFLIVAIMTQFLIGLLPTGGVLWFGLKAIICFGFVNLIFYLLFCHTGDFEYFYRKISSILLSKIRQH